MWRGTVLVGNRESALPILSAELGHGAGTSEHSNFSELLDFVGFLKSVLPPHASHSCVRFWWGVGILSSVSLLFFHFLGGPHAFFFKCLVFSCGGSSSQSLPPDIA
eukprot:1864421-Rhodomonas_salina.1